MTDTATPTTIPTWHHPHYISHERTPYSVSWQFKPFTGDEPEPKIPGDVEAAFKAARNAHPWDSDTGRAVSAASRDADAEERVANTLWRVARHNRHVIGLIQQVAPLVAAFQQAKKQAMDVYESLHATPDGFWQAKILTVVRLREEAEEAARQVDVASRELATTTDGLPERVLEELPAFGDLEKAAGVDLGDWYPQESYGYGPGPEVSALQKLFAEQDERIKQVARLFTQDGR